MNQQERLAANLPKVSIIIPVYNVSEYLRRGLDSVLSQSFQDFEVILVDDGSTDASGKMCDEYADSDSRIQVIHKENGGVSSARNAGLDCAKGEWVYFMDPDDVLLPDGLRTLVDGICEEVDAVMGGYEEISLAGTLLRSSDAPSEHVILDKSKSLRPLFNPYSADWGYVGHIWLRLFRMEVIRKYHIRFDPTVSIREGTLFVATFLCLSRGTTCFISKPIYRYYHRKMSAVRSLSERFNKKYLTSFDANVKIVRLINETAFIDSEVERCAKEEVMDRYRKTKRMMLKFGSVDEGILRDLRRKCIKELGVPFVAGYLFSWSRKKIAKKFRKSWKSCDR